MVRSVARVKTCRPAVALGCSSPLVAGPCPRCGLSGVLRWRPLTRRRRQRKQGLSPEDLAFLEWLRPILLNDQRQEMERLLQLPDPPR